MKKQKIHQQKKTENTSTEKNKKTARNNEKTANTAKTSTEKNKKNSKKQRKNSVLTSETAGIRKGSFLIPVCLIH